MITKRGSHHHITVDPAAHTIDSINSHDGTEQANNNNKDLGTSSILLLMIFSAILFELASRCAWYMKAASVQLDIDTPSIKTPGSKSGSSPLALENGFSLGSSGTNTGSGLKRTQSGMRGPPPAVYQGLPGVTPTPAGSSKSKGSKRGKTTVWEQAVIGFDLTWRSVYLRHICTFLIFHYLSSSGMYFLKSLTAATVTGSAADRMGWFAAINSAAAACILCLQLLATGRALRALGEPLALAALPMVSTFGMACIALHPTPMTVGAADVARKIATYALERPARYDWRLFIFLNIIFSPRGNPTLKSYNIVSIPLQRSTIHGSYT